jgi:hypothetical protein
MRAVTALRGLAAGSLMLVAMVQGASAQRSALREVRDWGLAGASLAVAVPVGEFATHVGEGGGIDGFMTFNLDRFGMTALRIDGSLLAYGRSTEHGYIDGPYYYEPVDLITTSWIVSLRAGPQITIGQGPIKMYGFGLAGFSVFTTSTQFSSYDCGCGSYDEVTEHDDLNLAWEAGGGLLVPLGHRQRVMLDLGARYLRNGRAQYLPARFVGSGTTVPLESEANLVAIHFGVTFALR